MEEYKEEIEVSAGEYLVRRGNIFRQVGKYGFFIGFALLLSIIIIVAATKNGVNVIWYLFNSTPTIMIITLLASAGVCCWPLYFIGLHIIGLGFIALNTNIDKKLNLTI